MKKSHSTNLHVLRDTMMVELSIYLNIVSRDLTQSRLTTPALYWASCCRASWPTLSPSCYCCSYSWAMLNIWFKNWCFATFPLLVGFLLLPDLLMMNWSKLFTTSWSNLFTICCLALVLFSSRNSRLKSEKPIRWQNWTLLPIFTIQALNIPERSWHVMTLIMVCLHMYHCFSHWIKMLSITSGDLKYDLCSPHFFIFHPLSGGRNGLVIQALLGGDFKLCCLINSTASILISLY